MRGAPVTVHGCTGSGLTNRKKIVMKSAPELSIERLVERMRAGARRQSIASGARASENGSEGNNFVRSSQVETQFADFTDIKPDRLVLQASFAPHPDDHYHVNDLLKYSDRNFIQNAYRAILKRGPDATGYADFIAGLRSGRLNKLDVLARLRYSAEGRAKKVRVDGLFFPASLRLAYNLPIVGYLLNLAVGIARLPKSIRHLQQFEAHVLAQQEQIADHANRSNAALVAIAAEVPTALAHLQQSTSAVNEQQAERLEKTTQQQEELAAQARQQFEELQRFKREQQQFETSIAKLIEEQGRSLASFASEQGERAAALALGQQHAESLISEHQRHLSSFITEEQEQLSRIYAQLEHFQKLIDTQGDTAAANRAELKQQSAELVTRAEEMNAAREVQLELLAKELRAELAHVFSKQQEIRAELVLQAQRANVLLDKARQALAEPGASDYVAAMAGEGEHSLDAFYLTLEEQFRGSRAEIKDRLRVYLPLIAGAGIGSSQKPILDVGCGRGEWLELLKENGVRASGIDSNRMQVARSLEFGVDVTEAELLTHLRAMDDSSLGAVTGFHIVEHLPMETLVAFLDETVRVVQPGGLVIFETPNPENVLVGSCNFYFDPTHRNPLPAPVLKFLVESRGYQDVQILKLNPSDEARVEGDTDVAKRFNQYFYGPMDYAVVGRRGRTDDDAALSAKR